MIKLTSAIACAIWVASLYAQVDKVMVTAGNANEEVIREYVKNQFAVIDKHEAKWKQLSVDF